MKSYRKPRLQAILYITCIIQIPVLNCRPQPREEASLKPDSIVRVVFYNTENLFHPSDDSTKNDESFTPAGDHHWTYSRYKKKLDNIGRCLAITGSLSPPGIIGLCEIENRQVLIDLANKTILSGTKYKIIHKESPDPRGIDVGMLYDPDIFSPEEYELISVDTSGYHLKTREMLHVRGLLFGTSAIHIFIVHWPSRRGGQLGSEKNRILAANLLKNKTRMIMRTDSLANILIMGDFNDNPEDRSLHEVLKAEKPSDIRENTSLVNLMFDLASKNEGSYCHLHNFLEWDNLDQVIVSGAIYRGLAGLKIKDGKAFIFRKPFLLDRDGLRLFSTYSGLKYSGGFSDHLPVYTDIVVH